MHGGMRCIQAPLIVAGSPLQEPIRPTYAMRQGVVGAASLEANVLWRRAAVALKRCYAPGGIVRCMSSIRPIAYIIIIHVSQNSGYEDLPCNADASLMFFFLKLSFSLILL